MKTVADPETKVYCIRVIGVQNMRIAVYPLWLKMTNGVWYYSEPGITISDFDTSLTFTPPIIELKGSFSDHGITREDLLRGNYVGAKVYIFATSWLNPIEDEEPIGAFIMDAPNISGDNYTIELRHVIDALNLTPELTYIDTCLNTFCDSTPSGDAASMSYCGLSSETYIETGEITSITGLDYYASDRAEAADWFKRGYIRFYAVVNSVNVWTQWYEVIAFDAGVFTLFETPLYNSTQIEAGTLYQARVGCDKTLTSCRDKFDNVAPSGGGGFFGFPNIPNGQQSGKIGGRG